MVRKRSVPAVSQTKLNGHRTLHSDGLVAQVVDHLLLVLHSDGRHVRRLELLIDELGEKAGLSDASLTENQNFHSRSRVCHILYRKMILTALTTLSLCSDQRYFDK